MEQTILIILSINNVIRKPCAYTLHTHQQRYLSAPDLGHRYQIRYSIHAVKTHPDFMLQHVNLMTMASYTSKAFTSKSQSQCCHAQLCMFPQPGCVQHHLSTMCSCSSSGSGAPSTSCSSSSTPAEQCFSSNSLLSSLHPEWLDTPCCCCKLCTWGS